MTEYVYTVRSNKPLLLAVGIGNMPSIGAGSYGMGLTVRDRVERKRSNGAAASENHEMSMELIERIEEKPQAGPFRGMRAATADEAAEDYLKREAALDKAVDEGRLSTRQAEQQRAALAEFRGYDRPITVTPNE